MVFMADHQLLFNLCIVNLDLVYVLKMESHVLTWQMGTTQGCIISSFLFILYVNELVNECKKAGCEGIFVSEEASNIILLLYADDLALN